MTTHLTSILLWETLQTYHGSKDFRCGLMSLDASVSAAILFPPFSPPPPLPRPIMDQRISGGALCLSMLLCLLPFSSLPSPLPPPPSGLSWIKGLRCGLVSLDASVSATILFPPLPPPPPTYYESKDFRCGLVSLDASVSAAILFPPLPFYESPFFYEER